MSLDTIYDFIVVGSGCTGAQSAQTLIEKNKRVLMLDVGNDNSGKKFPNKDFLQIRKAETNQQELFLGKEYEGIPWGQIKPGYHLTPGRKHVVKDISKFAPYSSDSFQPFESLALGGLGAAWGAGSYTFNNEELNQCGLEVDTMNEAYRTLFARIGVTKGNDENDYKEEEALEADRSIHKILKTYAKKKKYFDKKEIHLKRTPLAALSTNFHTRKKYQYKDMDFWHDEDKSVYRPWITVENLLKSDKFTYTKNQLVTHFKELEDKVQVYTLNTSTGAAESFYCKKLLLGASVFGTTRIVLRSFNAYNTKVKFLCNSYYYIPILNFKMLGKKNSEIRTGLSQLTLYLKNNKALEIANFFTYRSLLLFKLIKESPLNIKTSRLLFKFLQSSLLVVGFHISKSFEETDFLTLSKSKDSITGDILDFASMENKASIKKEKVILKQLKKSLFKLKCLPLKVIKTPNGSSIHYAGTLPFSKEETILTTNDTGRLHKTKNVYIVDASSFCYLPAKGVTLTAMANAHRVTLNVLNEL
jgi:hypothetical protein